MHYDIYDPQDCDVSLEAFVTKEAGCIYVGIMSVNLL